VRIERLLKEDYERTPTVDPARASAYDRFLRRRARYARRVAGAASLALVAAVALTVTVPRVLADRQDVANPPKGQVVSRPELGYELVVPPGWQVAHDGAASSPELSLEPAPGTPGAAPPGVMPAPTTHPRTGSATTVWIPRPPRSRIWVDTTVLRPGAYPDYPDANRGRWQGDLLGFGSYTYTPIDGPYRSGRRPDGRGFIVQGSPRDPNGQRYYVAWPYHCADGVRCPTPLRYRALVVTGWAATDALARANEATLRRVVDTIRPVANAWPGGAAGRPDCRLDWRDQHRDWLAAREPDDVGAVWVTVMTEGTTNPAASDFVLTFTSANLAMCRVRAGVTVELLEGGRLAAVQGNGASTTIEGDLPEGDGESPNFTRAWLWRNWCGSGNVSLRIGGPGGAVVPAKRLRRPGCADPGKPSTLVATTLPVRPGP
jgi:hypothetical protein